MSEENKKVEVKTSIVINYRLTGNQLDFLNKNQPISFFVEDNCCLTLYPPETQEPQENK